MSLVTTLTRLDNTNIAPFEVFLSHARTDTAQVRLVKVQMEALGVRVYLALHDRQPGTSVSEKIKAAIRRADAMVVLLTTEGADSAYVQQEIGVAKGCDKLVVPLVDRGVSQRKLGMLGEHEWIQVDFDDPVAAMAIVANSLRPAIQLRQREKRAAAQRETLAAMAVIVLVGLAIASIASGKVSA